MYKRKMKPSSRGIYIQDRQLTDIMAPGSNYRYVLDMKRNKLYIMPSGNKTSNTASKRKIKGAIKSVIDIRRKEITKSFSCCDYLELIIKKNIVVVEGFAAEKEETITENNIGLIFSEKSKLRRLFKKKIPLKTLLKVSGLEYSIENNIGIDTENLSSDLEIPLKVISLFSGAGLMDKSFYNNKKFKIIYALEKNSAACQTYRKNIGEHIVCDDINSIDKESLPNSDILIGGPPCVGFSMENRNTNYLENPNNFLVSEFVKTVLIKKPLLFLMENVPNMLNIGNGRFKNEIEEKLSDYNISSAVLNNIDYCGSAERKRAIIIGSKIGKVNLPKPFGKPKVIRETFKGLSDDVPNQMDYTKPGKLALERYKNIPPGGNIFDLPDNLKNFKGIENRHSNSYRRLQWDKPSITLVHPRKIQLLHPEKNRIITVREAARIQGLPDDFVLSGTLDQKYLQVINGLPIQLGTAIVNVIEKAFNNYLLQY